MKNKTLATSATCGPCQYIKAQIKQLGLTIEMKDFSDPSTHEWFSKHGIKSVPQLVVEENDDVTIVRGTDEILKNLQE